MRWLACVVVAAIVPLSMACEAEDEGGALSTGIDPDVPLQDVSEADARAACERLAAQIQSSFPPTSLCTAFAVFFTQTPDQCRQLVDQCVQNGGIQGDGAGDGAGEDGSDDECRFDPESVKDCSATVAELEACINESVASARAALSALDCSQAGQLVGEGLSDPDPGPQCKALEAKCPGILDDSDTNRTKAPPPPGAPDAGD